MPSVSNPLITTCQLLLKYIEMILKFLIVINAIILVGSASLQVLARHVVKTPLPWTEELTRFSFIWLIMLAIPLGTRYQRQLGVDLISDHIAPRYRSLYLLIIELITLLIAAVFIYISWEFLQKNLSRTAVTMPLSMKYIYVSGPICGLFLTIFQIERVVQTITKGGKAL